jgi:hypothetical protein
MAWPQMSPPAESATVPEGEPIPAHLVKKASRGLEAPVDELVDQGIIGSGEVLAAVVPQITPRDGIFDGISQIDIAAVQQARGEQSIPGVQVPGGAGARRRRPDGGSSISTSTALVIDPKAGEWAGLVGDETAVTFFPAAVARPVKARDSSRAHLPGPRPAHRRSAVMPSRITSAALSWGKIVAAS